MGHCESFGRLTTAELLIETGLKAVRSGVDAGLKEFP
jgi:hypothetical protein